MPPGKSLGFCSLLSCHLSLALSHISWKIAGTELVCACVCVKSPVQGLEVDLVRSVMFLWPDSVRLSGLLSNFSSVFFPIL